jgi:hypothetical protein
MVGRDGSIGTAERGCTVTYFVAMPFVTMEGGLAPGRPVSVQPAMRRAEAMARSEANAGAIAFSHLAIRASASSTIR